MTLIIKELVVKSTIVDREVNRDSTNHQQLKEEIVKACMNKLTRQLKKKKER